MTLSELIEHVGNENVEMQYLTEGKLDMQAGKRDGSVTFWTGLDKVHDLMSGERKYTGIVIWLPTERLPNFRK